MLTEQYKVKKETLRFDAPKFGFALCCGEKPKVNFDSKQPNYMYSIGVIGCPVCNKQVGVIANAGSEQDRVGFLYHYWNIENIGNSLHGIPEGFSIYSINAEYLPHGSLVRSNIYFAILKIDDKKIYQYSFYTEKITEFEFPKSFKSANYSLTECSLNYKRWPVLSICAYNFKWAKKIDEFFKTDLVTVYGPNRT